jgi:hypothetical protein
VSIEWIGSGCCVPDADSSETGDSTAALPVQSDADCGGCKDEPLLRHASASVAGQALHAPLRQIHPPVPPVATEVVARLVAVQVAQPSWIALRAANPPPLLMSLRTVVIRV